MMALLAVLITGLSVGLYAGVKLANRGWKQNANEVMRMEMGGKLYKVMYADQWDKLKRDAGWEPKEV